MYGAGNEIRTRDPRLGKAVLYRWAIPACTWCLRTESNCRHTDFQSVALPTELPRHEWRPRSDLNWRSSPWQGDMLTATPRGRVSTLVDYSYILTRGNLLMQVLFSNFLMNFSKIYEIGNYLLKIANISHLYLVCLNILQIIPIITEIKNACKADIFFDLWLS